MEDSKFSIAPIDLAGTQKKEKEKLIVVLYIFDFFEQEEGALLISI